MRALEQMMEGIHEEVLVEGMYTLVEQIRDLVIGHAPKHTGELIDDVHADVVIVDEIATGSVYSTLFYAPYQEFGWEPGTFPNVDNITWWAEQHNIDPWALAVALFTHGYEGKFMYTNAMEILERWAANADVAGFDTTLGKLVGRVWEKRHQIIITGELT